MRILGAGLQEAQLFLDANLLWCRDDGTSFSLGKRLQTLNAKPVVDERNDNVTDDGLSAAGKFTVVSGRLANLADYYKWKGGGVK